MGIFAYHIGKMDIPEEHRAEYAQQALELLRAGGMMTVEELKLYRKKIYLLSPPEFDEDGRATGYYNYFEKDSWESRWLSAKHGRRQEQRVPDEYVTEVSRFFDATTNKLFSKTDFNANFDYHAQRRALAQEVCAAYTAKLKADPSYRKVLYNELADYWHRNKKKDRGKLEPLSYFDKPYKLRGPNREKALKMGYPTEYDRLALRATSVFHLAHWRDDVSVASYVTAR